VTRRHLPLLGVVSLVVAAISAGARLGILSGAGLLHDFATASWVDEMVSGGKSTLPSAIYAAVAVSSLVSIAGGLAVSGVAAACVSVDAVGRRPTHGAVRRRLAGRTAAMIVAAVLLGLAVTVGSGLLIVPGVLAYVVWAVAAPVAVMEGFGPAAAMARAARLTRGHRGRIFGVTLLVVVITYLIELVIISVVVAPAGSLSDTGLLIATSAVGVVVSAFTVSWVAAVIALLYVDIRVRSENLAPALRAFAAGNPPR
jgi:hypothetical protein